MNIYDSNQVDVIIADIPILSGRGEEGGKFLEIDYLSDAFVDTVSVDGTVTRSPTNDERANCMLTLMQGSPSNDLLSALHVADKLAKNGAGVGAFLVKDRSGRTLYTGDACWIVKMPKNTMGQKAGPLEWPIRIANLKAFIGGN